MVENTSIGFPLFQSILGQFPTPAVVDALIQAQILATPYVTGVQSVTTTVNPNTNEANWKGTVTTAFGPVIQVSMVGSTFSAVID